MRHNNGRVAIIANSFRAAFCAGGGNWKSIDPERGRELYIEFRSKAEQRGDAQYLFGNGGSIKGLFGSYFEKGYAVSIINLEYFEKNMIKVIEASDILDFTLCSYPSEQSIMESLFRGRIIIGYRHPYSDFKNVQSYFISENITCCSSASVPVQVYIPSGTAVTPEIQKDIIQLFDNCDMVIVKGNSGARSFSNNLNYFFAVTSSIGEVISRARNFNNGIVIQELIQTEDFQEGANGVLHKTHFGVIDASGQYGLKVKMLGEGCLKIPNHVDTGYISREKVVNLKDAVSCPGSWLIGDVSTVPGIDCFSAGLQQLDPLGSISSVDVMITSDCGAKFLESTHFAGSFLDVQCFQKAPIDYTADICGFKSLTAEKQYLWWKNYRKKISIFKEQGFFDTITITGINGPQRRYP